MKTTFLQDSDQLSSDSVSPSGSTSFLRPITDELSMVEELLRNEIRSDVKAAYTISGHTLSAGGKRLRPALVILAAKSALNEFPSRTIVASAAAAELIHMASLIHDDVVDGASERRGKPTANAEFGNQISVLVGDYLLAKSINLAAREGNLDVIREFSRVTIELSEGEVLQIGAKGNPDTDSETYLQIVKMKTAGFIAGCCAIGGMLANANPEQIHALRSYGISCGIAFQIADDLLDYVGDPLVTGKAIDGDLREGKMTLPLILALSSADESERQMVGRIVKSPHTIRESDVHSVHDLIVKNDGHLKAKAVALNYLDSAEASASLLPASIFRDSLVSLARFSVNRQN